MIEITEYETVANRLDEGETVLTARGMINDMPCEYTRFSEDVEPGIIPKWFIDAASLEFAQMELWQKKGEPR